MKSHIRDELFSRRVELGNENIIIEFNNNKWCLEATEIDDSVANGYAGIKIHQALHKFDFFNECEKNKLINQINSFVPGYQLGSGFLHIMMVALGIKNVEYISHFYDVDTIDISAWGDDLFQGLAGSLLTADLLLKKSSSKKIENFRTVVCQELLIRLRAKPTIKAGFAHGDLGIVYALLAANIITSQTREYIENILTKAEYDISSSTNYAVCSGAISFLVVDSIAMNRGLKKASHNKHIELIRKIANNIIDGGDVFPLHQCCGVAGIVETLICYSKINYNPLALEFAQNISNACITRKAIGKINETGMLFGVAGIDYVISRMDKKSIDNSSMLYPFLE